MFLANQGIFYIIYPQDVYTSEGYKGTIIAHCYYEHDSSALILYLLEVRSNILYRIRLKIVLF